MDEPETLILKPEIVVNGQWRLGAGDHEQSVVNPATGETIVTYRSPTFEQIEDAVSGAARAFRIWRGTPAFERGKLLRAAAALLRQRKDYIARILTSEEGKPLEESRGEVASTADMFDWFAEEAVRAYGRIIPPRALISW